VKFAETLIFRSKDGQLLAFDGTAVTGLSIPDTMDHNVDAEKLVVLSGRSHMLYSTTNLLWWKIEGQVSESGTAVGLLDGIVYSGTSGAEVYRLRLP
jgi:hypothetical protein